MVDLGNFVAGDVIDFKFSTTVDGTPTVFTGSPAVSVYKANGTTESTAGVTLTADFDSRVGLNHVRITTVTDGTFYAAGSDFDVVITTGTVGGVTQIGITLAHFSIGNRSVVNVSGTVATVTNGVTLASNAVTAAALASDAVDEIWDETIGDGTLTSRQAMRILVAALAGKLSGASTTTVTIRNAADSANVIVATVDSDGNRSAITVTP